MKRRDFLKTAGVAGTTSLAQPSLIFADPRQAAAYFQLHPFVADHPEAVFIKRTTVSDKSAFDEKIEAGRIWPVSCSSPATPMASTSPLSPTSRAWVAPSTPRG